MDEISPFAPTDVVELKDNKINEFKIDPKKQFSFISRQLKIWYFCNGSESHIHFALLTDTKTVKLALPLPHAHTQTRPPGQTPTRPDRKTPTTPKPQKPPQTRRLSMVARGGLEAVS